MGRREGCSSLILKISAEYDAAKTVTGHGILIAIAVYTRRRVVPHVEI